MIWKVVKGFDNYEISTSGIIANLETNYRLKGYLNNNRQKCVTIRKNGKNYNKIVDLLLFETFGKKIFTSNKESEIAQTKYNNSLIKIFNYEQL